MVKGEEKEEEEENRSIFRIMDGIMEQVEKTKRIFIILIVTIMIPITISILFIIVFDAVDHEAADDDKGSPVKVIIGSTIVIIMAFGIRQIIILNRWTKRYKKFQTQQAELDEKLSNMDEKDPP